MKWSQLLVPTSKEIPGDAEIPSHQLMLRAGMIRRIASGTYAYLPMGLKVLQQIQNIIREEMNATGAQEVLMPAIQPIELWKKTGRDRDYGETLGTFVDRHGRTNVLAPTAEEVFTFIGSNEINSYKVPEIKKLPPFTGGAVGYISYDSVSYFEDTVIKNKKGDLELPESIFLLTESLVVFDHVKQTIFIIVYTKINNDNNSEKRILHKC